LKRAILLDRPAGQSAFRVCFWVDSRPSRQKFAANSDLKSEFKDATAEEVAALRSGAVVERVETISVGSSGLTPAEWLGIVRETAVDRLTALQREVAAEERWTEVYGTYWDGEVWQ
jgi:hypothetical protein